MKKIKSFTHFDDSVINMFIDISKGKIVNYNPIVIEYDDKNLKEDPYKDYNIFKAPSDIILIGSYTKNNQDLESAKYYRFNADTICLPKNGDQSAIKLLKKDIVVLDNVDSSHYFTLSAHPKNGGHLFSSLVVCGGGYFFQGYTFIDSYDNMIGELKEMGFVQLNYNSLFN